MPRAQREFDMLDEVFSQYAEAYPPNPSPPPKSHPDDPLPPPKPVSATHSDRFSTAPPAMPFSFGPSASPAPQHGWAELLTRGTMLAFALLAGLCFWQTLPFGHSSVTARQVEFTSGTTTATSATTGPETRRIKDIRVGDRVLSRPLAEYGPFSRQPTQRHPAETHPKSWRLIRLQFFQPDGEPIDAELLRSAAWVDQCGLTAGETCRLELSEEETRSEALILAIEPCPPIKPGVGEVVTGTFSHVAAAIIDLHVEGESEPIGVTPGHPFWSVDRQDFVPVGELRIGERLRTIAGGQACVSSITPRGPPERVYNLEIAGEHQYHVASTGLLAHNTCTVHRHHSDPIFMGGKRNQPTTILTVTEHKRLHRDLNDFLKGKTNSAGNHMRPQRGNSGRTIRKTFTTAERRAAMAEFYTKFREKYPTAAKDYFAQHPDLE